MTAFDPADWLARFTAADGWYVVTPGGPVLTGWRLDGKEDDARTVWREIKHNPEKREAIRERVLGVPPAIVLA